MKTTDKKTYLTPISKCTEVENTELICDSTFNTDDDPKEMDDDDTAGSKFRGFSFSFEQDE